MGRSLGTDVRDTASRPGGSGAARGSRVLFVLRRTGSAPLLPASLLLAIVVSVTVTTGLAGFAGRALPAAAHARLARAPATAIGVSGQFGAAQARADGRVIRSLARSALGTVPFAVASGRWSDQLALPRPPGASQPPLIQAAVLSGVRAHVTLTAGTWPGPRRPGAPLGVALPVTTARLLHFSVGQALVLPDSLTGTAVRLTVTGLFRPRDPAAPYWRLSLLGTSGKLIQGTFVTYGPMLADASALGPDGLPVSAASWLITVDAAAIPPGSAGRLGHRLGAVVTTLRGREDLGGLQVTTGLPEILGALASSLVVSRSLLLIGSLELLLLATTAAALAARLLASQRDGETALLSARGAARGQLLLATLAEAALLALAGAVAGIVAGGYLADALLPAAGLAAHPAGGLPGVRRVLTVGAWWPAAVIVAGVIAVMMWPSLHPVTPGTVRARRGRPAVLAATARAGADAALIALGILALWELRRYSAAPRLSGGTLGIDPVLAVAPVLALAGIALLPLRVLPGRRAPAGPAERARQAAHRGPGQLAGEPPGRAGGQPGAARGPRRGDRHAGARPASELAPVPARPGRVRGRGRRPGQPGLAPPARRRRRARAGRGARAAMPVAATDSGFTVLALDATKAAGTVLLRPDLSGLPAARLWRRITPRTAGPGLALPGRPARLAIEAALLPPHGAQPAARPGRPRAGVVSLSVEDGSGAVYTVPAGTLPADGRAHQLVGALGAGRARYPLRLLGLSVTLPAARVPGAARPQRGGPGGGAAGRAAPRGRPRHAGRPRPGRLPADLGRLPAAVRRGGRPGPVARGGVLRGPGQPAGPRDRARRHLLAGQRGRGRAHVHGRGRAPGPAQRAATAAGDRPADAQCRDTPAADPGARDPGVPQLRGCPPRGGRPAAGG